MSINDLVYIPFHDWRKIVKEGSRTRDAHFIEQFRLDNNIKRLIILNRPITIIELLLKKKTVNKKVEGDIVFKLRGGCLYKIDDKTYVVDFFLNQSFKQILKGRKWFFLAFGNKELYYHWLTSSRSL